MALTYAPPSTSAQDASGRLLIPRWSITSRGTLRQPRRQLGQVVAVEVDLEVPAAQLGEALGEFELVEVAAAEEVDPVGADAAGVERQDLAVGDVRRDVGHADEALAELLERVEQVGLVVGLEGAGDDRAARDVQVRGAGAVVGDRERLGQVALVGDERKPRIDHVEVRVEDRHFRKRDIPPMGFTRMTVFMHITTARRRLNARALAILQTAVAALAAWYVCIALLPDEKPVFACIAAVIAIGASHGAAPPARHAARVRRRHRPRGRGRDHPLHRDRRAPAGDHGRAGDVGRGAAQRLRARDLRGRGLRDAARDHRARPATPRSRPNRILEAAIGGAVALAIALLFSPDPKLPVSRAAQAVFGRLGRALEGTANALDDGDPARAEQALEQARSIEGLLRELDAELATSRETVRTAPTRFGDREPIDRYDRSLEQIDFAVRNTRVLARHSLRALRGGEAPVALRDAVSDLAGSVWALAASYDEP